MPMTPCFHNFDLRMLTAQKSRGEMPSPAMIQRYKQCQQKIAEVETMLASGDKNVLIACKSTTGIESWQQRRSPIVLDQKKVDGKRASQANSVGVKKKIPQAPNLISKKLDVTTGEMQAFQGRLGNASASFSAFQAKC
ncbi:hypothetical protein P5673_000340 [Acropora cervicornis]|uniref:Uncharacterized protein n=1 Tax=Acropora cervicornis TaxID=6130 RepID=A0AAD9VGZ2_ACRCE|nr:hypothetical protein P5673_000340 [Acropora cervicornis]